MASIAPNTSGTCSGKSFAVDAASNCTVCGCWVRDGRHTRLWVTANGVDTVAPKVRPSYMPAGVAAKHTDDGIRQAAERTARRTAAPVAATAPVARPATPGQLAFVADLRAELTGKWLGADLSSTVVAELGADGSGLTFDTASAIIVAGTAARKAARTAAPVAAAGTVTEPGLYRHAGSIVRVERSKCGRYLNTATLVLSGKRVQLDDGTEVDGYKYATTYDRGALLRSLDAGTKLDAAAVVEAGRATVCCVDCGTTLRNYVSRTLGIGPVCGGHGNRPSALKG
jgi:hypothetical protein